MYKIFLAFSPCGKVLPVRCATRSSFLAATERVHTAICSTVITLPVKKMLILVHLVLRCWWQQTRNTYANEQPSLSKFVNNLQSSKLLILNFMIKTPEQSCFISDVTYRNLAVDKVTKFKKHSDTDKAACKNI